VALDGAAVAVEDLAGVSLALVTDEPRADRRPGA
jgi:hypothetical protein